MIKIVYPSDIEGQKFICMPSGSSLGNITEAFTNNEGIDAEKTIICDYPQYVRSYVEMDM